jgi:cytochrome c peroxidase
MYKEILTAILLLTAFVGLAMAEDELSLEELGKALFFDTALSTPPGQSCATCHAGEVGWTGPDSDINNAGSVYPGAADERYGNRKPPTSAYGGESPLLYYDEKGQVWVGGMFWDGRATGWELGDPLAEQAMGPFLNPLEQNNPDKKQVCLKVKNSDYADYASLFIDAWGEGSLDCVKDVDGTYERIARSIAAYERSTEVSAFTSKYDLYLKGEVKLTKQEKDGLKLFNGKGNCANCHISKETKEIPPLFTDFTYDNLGIPKNMENPFYTMPTSVNPLGEDWVDLGLGGFLMNIGYAPAVYEQELGKMKVPTLRNVDKRPVEGSVKAFGHNGYFKSLYDIVHFYNTRDVLTTWPAAEVPVNVNTDELGDLGLTEEEELAIVAFMQTLSDGYTSDE